MYFTFITILSFLLAIIILVTVHEYGHFIVARLCGVKVLKFSIGFGPTIFSRTDKYGTEFKVAPIPLGGYVKMLDKREGEVPSELEDYEFTRKHPLKKIAIVVAGPLFNIILAFVLFYFMYIYGIDIEKPVIQYVEPGSVAESAGIKPGQEIYSVDGNRVISLADFQVALASRLGTEGDLKIETIYYDRKQQKSLVEGVKNTHAINIDNWEADLNSMPASRSLGMWVFPPQGLPLLVVSKLNTNGYNDSIQVGDIIKKYNNNLIDDWTKFLDYIKQNPNKRIVLIADRDGIDQELNVQIGDKSGVGSLGIAFRYPIYREAQNFGVFESIPKAIARTYNYTSQTFYMIYKLVVGQLGVETVRGPVMVARVAGVQMQLGLSNFIDFLAIISIGLAVINILPIPILDGGHLVYHSYELITGKSFTEKAEKISLLIGLFLLILIMGMAFYNDIVYW